jgi:lysophospholipase L1-like esterase
LTERRLPFRPEWVFPILAVAICLGVVNLALASFMPWLNELPQPWQRARFMERMEHPVAKVEPFFSSHFIQESLIQPGEWKRPEDADGFVLPGIFSGKFFHVERLAATGNSYRRTINLPGDSNRILVLFLGGSTVYGGEVPDDMTLPSQFADELKNALPGIQFEVLNAGVYSATSTQELARLKYELEKGLRPHLVISYSGVNDVSEGLYFRDARSSRMGYTKEAREKAARMQQPPPAAANNNYFTRIPQRLKQTTFWRLTETIAYRRNTYIAPPHLSDPKVLQELAEQTARIYEENLGQMAALAKTYGFRFVSILQPQAYYGEYRVRSDIENVPKYDGSTPDLGIAHRLAYPRMRETVRAARLKGISSFDLSLSLVDKDIEIFYDFCHLNSSGNRLVAKAMLQALRGELSQSQHRQN